MQHIFIDNCGVNDGVDALPDALYVCFFFLAVCCYFNYDNLCTSVICRLLLVVVFLTVSYVGLLRDFHVLFIGS